MEAFLGLSYLNEAVGNASYPWVNMKYVALLSGGKDSCFNLVHCAENGHELVAAASLGPEVGKGRFSHSRSNLDGKYLALQKNSIRSCTKLLARTRLNSSLVP